MQQCQQSAAAAASSSGSGRNGDGDVKGYWLHKNIVVKVMHKELADGRYYKRKGVVEEVIDRYAAKVQLLDSKTALKLDQEYLETVIPQAGGRVLIVNGRHRGLRGRLESLDIDRFCAQIMLREGPNRGDVVTLPYEHFSKLAEEES